ncbi:uncharacterized protein DEA37_0009945 [Paragonimus westermani]|uniref:Uncharacterized protein n=1 Tax=Paragonimus westermani TaxID=34504 RepID=A0A5J4NI51_9TREM|nr:uncharacterized protein DEA37_0009945 [Paragonimus westermani]
MLPFQFDFVMDDILAGVLEECGEFGVALVLDARSADLGYVDGILLVNPSAEHMQSILNRQMVEEEYEESLTDFADLILEGLRANTKPLLDPGVESSACEPLPLFSTCQSAANASKLLTGLTPFSSDTNHRIDVNKAFRVVYRVTNAQPKTVHQRILVTAESIAVRLRNLNLCSQKKFVQSLQPPWPQINHIHLTTQTFDLHSET